MELNEIEKTNGSTMQEFDFTDITTENSLSEIAEKLSPEETTAAIQHLKNSYASAYLHKLSYIPKSRNTKKKTTINTPPDNTIVGRYPCREIRPINIIQVTR